MRTVWATCGAVVVVLLATLAVWGQGAGQQAPPPPPPGTEIEYLDARGALKKGKFVELLPNGAVKIRIEDGSTRLMPPNRVRLAGGAAAPAEKPSTPDAVKPTMDKPPGAVSGEQPAAPRPAGRLQRWTDATGKFTIEAEFVSLEDGQVELKKADGKVIKIPLDKLSGLHQSAANSAADEALEASAAIPQAQAVALIKASDPKELTTVNPSAAAEITLKRPGTWTAKADPPSQVTVPKIADRFEFIPSTSTSHRAPDWDLATGIAIDSAHHWLWAGLSYGESTNRLAKLERIDLTTGKRLSPISLALHVRPLTFSPSGNLLVTLRCKENGLGDQDHLDIWSVSGDTLTAVHSFKPFTGKQFNGVPYFVDGCAFVDERHLLTWHNLGMVILWDLEKLTPVYQVNFTTGWVALSPGRKCLAIAAYEGVYLLDSLTGKVLGQAVMTPTHKQPTDALFGTSVAFTNDGAQVVCTDNTYIHLWNLADGKLNKAIKATPNISGELSFSPDNRFLVWKHQQVFDLESGYWVFGFGTTSPIESYGGREIVLFDRHLRRTKVHEIVAFEVYHPEIIKRAAVALEKNEIKANNSVQMPVKGRLDRLGIRFW